MSTKHIISYSGGKDSTAMYLRALELGIQFQPVFADTGNENDITLDYVRTIHEKTGGPEVRIVKADFARDIERKRKFIKEKWAERGVSEKRVEAALAALHPTGIPFLDLCMLKGRFPSTRARFCSEELKHHPLFYQAQEPLMAAGHLVVSWQGVRADESPDRAKMPRMDRVGPLFWNYRPILHWTVKDVFAIHKRHGLEPNPLYKLGFGRVGCFPCLHARKMEIRNIADRFPEHIERISEWEDLVEPCVKRAGIGAFFAADKTPGVDKSKPIPRVHEVVKWARTGRGGYTFDLFGQEGSELPTCSSLYGLCE